MSSPIKVTFSQLAATQDQVRNTVSNINTQQTPPPTAGASESVATGTRMVVKTVPGAGQRVFQGQGIALEVTR